MIRDIECSFNKSDATGYQALTASAASTDVIDLGAEGDAVGSEMWIIVKTGATALSSSGKAATLDIKLEGHEDASFSTGTLSFPLCAQIAEASCTANTELVKMRLPQGLERYIRVYYTVGTENFTAGTIGAYLVTDPEIRL